ncbi:hypothetical protein RISK_004360 [Rhodopirellula islandica]|uniref:Uncharacterized protein n=1 Tax=Rhodopirellula islandica TaxID=595434 RepID=A0A0J1BA59_RHOIS|nr:hypothetical protein RISK_004360 [Rhodopirellula islandica]
MQIQQCNLQSLRLTSRSRHIAPEGPSFVARGGSPENNREKQKVAPDGAVVGNAALWSRLKRTLGSGLGRDVARRWSAAGRNSWGQLF